MRRGRIEKHLGAFPKRKILRRVSMCLSVLVTNRKEEYA